MPLRSRSRSAAARESDQLLPEAEMEVLAVLQAEGEVNARAIRAILSSYRPMSHASVLTLLGRLEAKGLVSRRRGPVGKAFVYSVSRTPKPLYRALLRRILRRIFANDSASLVASLFDARVPTNEELRQIRDLVDELDARKR